MSKVAIIGATGNVGTFAAHAISEIPHVSEILLLAREGREALLEGIAADLNDSFAACGNYTRLTTSTDLDEIAGSELVVVTAGVPRRAGQDRLDLAYQNARIIAGISQRIGQTDRAAKILMITNPVDVMTSVALHYSGKDPQQVFGLGTHLDSMRLKNLIAQYFRVHVSEVHTRIIGEHGLSMVPLWSATTIGGIQIGNLPSFSKIPMKEMGEAVRSSGENIIRSKGSTVYGPGEAIASLVRTVLGNENRILTVSAYIRREVHNIGGVCIGVPARVNRRGVFPVTIQIDEDEVRAFQESVGKIRRITQTIMDRLLQDGDPPGCE